MKHLTHLLTGLLVVSTAGAAQVVLYETGWEAAPANPAWISGNAIGQNGWSNIGLPAANSNPTRMSVLANGSANAVVFGQTVTTPYGSQFVRFTASSSTTVNNQQYAWPDVAAAFDGRPTGFNLITCSMDFFVPAGDSGDGSLYGLFGFDDFTDGQNYLDFGVLIVPSSRVIRLVIDAADAAESATGAFPYDTWFNLGVQVNYDTGEVVVLNNGIPVPGLSETFEPIASSSLTDVDMFCQNSRPAPNPRVVFADNYRLTADSNPDAFPRLSISPAPGGEWKLCWSTNFIDWFVESTQDLGSGLWETEPVVASIVDGMACVAVPEVPPQTFYRLRKP